MEPYERIDESIRQGFATIADKLDDLLECFRVFREETPKEGHVLALIQAAQYQGYIQFQDLMLSNAPEMIRDSATVPPEGLNVEEAQRLNAARLVVAGLAKVMAPPFESSLKASMVTSRVQVSVEKDVDDALKVEAAIGIGETLSGFMSEDSWGLLNRLMKRTGYKPWKVIEEALKLATAKEVSDSLEGEMATDAERVVREGGIPDGSE